MRIALCFSGQPRYVERGAKYIKSCLLDYDNMDVFVHCWWDKQDVGKDVYQAWGNTIDEKTPDNMYELINKIYNPVSMKIEKQIEHFEMYVELRKKRAFLIKNISDMNKCVFAWHSQYYSIHQSNLLKQNYEKENGFLYDIVIRVRFDLAMKSTLKLSLLKSGWVYSCSWMGMLSDRNSGLHQKLIPNSYINYGVSDSFFFGDSRTMDVVTDMGNHIDSILNTTDVPYTPEFALNKYLDENDIKCNYLLPVRYVLMKYDHQVGVRN